MDYSFEIVDSEQLYERFKKDIIQLEGEFWFWVYSTMNTLYPDDADYMFQKYIKKTMSQYLQEKEQERITGIPMPDTDTSQKKFYSIPGNVTILLLVNNNPVARIGLEKVNNDRALVRKTFVKPEFRGRHFGDLLIDKTKELALANNYTVLRLLTVDFMKSAIKLYLRTGFNYCEYENESILTKEEAQSHGLSMELLLK